MNLWKARRRGIALVFAMFTVAVLLTLSVTFVAMAISQERTSATASHSQAALHAANYALDFALNYMGVGKHWGVSQIDASGFVVSFNLANTQGPVTYHGREVVVADDAEHPGFKKMTFPGGNLAIDENTGAQTTVWIREIRMGGQPTHYRVVAQAEVFDRHTGRTLASRVVEARVREQTAADYLHFIQNARAWDAPGNDPADPDLDLVGIPKGYQESGPSRIDGGGAVAGTAGNLRFFSAEGVTFSQATTIHKEGNLYVNPADADKEADIFLGGLTTGASSLGIPDKENYVSTDKNRNGIIESSEQGYASRLAADTSDGDYVSGRITVDGSNTEVGDGTFYADVEKDPSGKDARPGISFVEVILNGEKVTIQKRTRFSNKVDVIYRDVHYSKFKNGLIYVEGGNVKIRSAFDAQGRPIPWAGRLTVVANENAQRNPLGEDGKGHPQFHPNSIYHWKAREKFNNEPHNKPPYTAKELGLPGDGLYWPPPQENVEREGNTVIASDLEYAASGGQAPTLGLIAKNYILLNDERAERKYTRYAQDKMRLEVDAVLMSLDHSVQFDWDNLGNNPWHALLRNPLPDGLHKEFHFTGSIIGGFMDVEGDLGRHGYTAQEFVHDQNLKYSLPPNFPRWDKRDLPDGVALNWVILQYVDRASFTTEGMAG